jgi:hypothetical protein
VKPIATALLVCFEHVTSLMSHKKKLSTPQLRKSLETELGDLDEQLEKINALYVMPI